MSSEMGLSNNRWTGIILCVFFICTAFTFTSLFRGCKEHQAKIKIAEIESKSKNNISQKQFDNHEERIQKLEMRKKNEK